MNLIRFPLYLVLLTLLASCECRGAFGTDMRCFPAVNCKGQPETDMEKVNACKSKCKGNDWEWGSCIKSCECGGVTTG